MLFEHSYRLAEGVITDDSDGRFRLVSITSGTSYEFNPEAKAFFELLAEPRRTKDLLGEPLARDARERAYVTDLLERLRRGGVIKRSLSLRGTKNAHSYHRPCLLEQKSTLTAKEVVCNLTSSQI